MPESSEVAGQRSMTLGLLVVVFCLACLMGFLVVRDAVNRTVEHQAQAIAQIVASQAAAARSVYASEIVAKLARDGFGPAVDSDNRPGHVPIPAQFLKLVGLASTAQADLLYAYRPVSKWNLEASQGLTDDFLRWAWPQLEQQDRAAPAGPIAWRPVSRFEEQDGRRVLRFLAADPASQESCAACHNAYEQRADIRALRKAAGVAEGRQFAQHQLLGALSVTIPLDKAEAVAGSEITQATAFFFGILLASFVALMWFNWRLNLQRGQLRRAEREVRDANDLLAAREGVERAYAELSTYMRGIDQHALVSVTDPEGRIMQVNDKFVEASGYTREELIGQKHQLLASGVHDTGFYPAIAEAIRRGDVWRDEICQRAKDGRLYWVDTAIVPLHDAAGQPARSIAISIDITEQRKHEEVLHYQATHDALTDLPNRVLLLERLARAVARARVKRQRVVVFFIDLDKFKQINDSLGHGAGDEVLREMARRLLSLARGADTVARLGGDEFVVACSGLTREEAAALGARIREALQAPVALSGEQHTLGGSVGMAMFPDHCNDTEVLLKRADIAMYQAKARGGSEVCEFSPEMQDAIDVRVQMEARLREGISRGELVLHFQPQVDFQTGALVSLEALVRWQSPFYGLLMPGDFIPLAEESRLISDIDGFVLDAACRQMRRWHEQGHGWIRVAVNLAATNFSDPRFQNLLGEALAQHGIPPGVLELEVTESLAMRDPDTALALMHELKRLGILLAIDDFGTGYSNLGYLKRFPADRLKVDQSFVRGLMQNPQDRAIVAAVVRLAHNLNMRAIAEGVESEDEAILLYALDVDEIQGYWMARPQAAEEVAALFDKPLLLDPAAFLQRDALPVVLLVEDEEVTRRIMEALLDSFGVRVVSAASAEEALERFHQHAYAIAIVDHGLPGSSGIELLGKLRALMPHTVRVLATASSDPQVLRDAINIGGAAHFLPKPIDPDNLRKVVRDACWSTVAQRRKLAAQGG